MAAVYAVMYVKYAYIDQHHMLDSNDFVCGISVYVCSIYVSKYLAYMICMPNLVGIFVSGTYLVIADEVNITVGHVLTGLCKNLMYIPYSILDL